MQHGFGLLIFILFAFLPAAAAGQTAPYPDTMPADGSPHAIMLRYGVEFAGEPGC